IISLYCLLKCLLVRNQKISNPKTNIKISKYDPARTALFVCKSPYVGSKFSRFGSAAILRSIIEPTITTIKLDRYFTIVVNFILKFDYIIVSSEHKNNLLF